MASRIISLLKKLPHKWWFFLVLFLLYFIVPAYTSKPFNPQQTGALIVEVFSHSPLYNFSSIFPVFKILTLLMITGIIIFGHRMTRIFFAYGGIVILASAWLQNMAETTNYGFAVISGNVAVFSIVALFWLWEAFAGESDFSRIKPPLWKYWVVPLALLAFWEPFSISNNVPVPDFNPILILTSDGAVVFCMTAPVYLAVLTFFHPWVNIAVLRITAFTGMVTGLLNMVQWFVLMPEGWWMGILHIPLLSISIYAFILSLHKPDIRLTPASLKDDLE
ncbi:MAG: hypothetical protein JW969_20215 [Spirochaetales bacterium]|nr:hypothetical protein [Spirochaetales bacterium]